MDAEQKRAYARAYYQAHRKEICERISRWRREHLEKRREYERKDRIKHPDKVLAKNRRKVRRWRERNPELNKERQRRYDKTYYYKHREKLLANQKAKYQLKKQTKNTIRI